jgi:hypothetical protein
MTTRRKALSCAFVVGLVVLCAAFPSISDATPQRKLGSSPNSGVSLQTGSGWTIKFRTTGDVMPGGGRETILYRVFECPEPGKCGTASYSELNVARGANLTFVATIPISPDFVVTSIAVLKTAIYVSGLKSRFGDRRCCPTWPGFEVWTFAKETWTGFPMSVGPPGVTVADPYTDFARNCENNGGYWDNIIGTSAGKNGADSWVVLSSAGCLNERGGYGNCGSGGCEMAAFSKYQGAWTKRSAVGLGNIKITNLPKKGIRITAREESDFCNGASTITTDIENGQAQGQKSECRGFVKK